MRQEVWGTAASLGSSKLTLTSHIWVVLWKPAGERGCWKCRRERGSNGSTPATGAQQAFRSADNAVLKGAHLAGRDVVQLAGDEGQVCNLDDVLGPAQSSGRHQYFADRHMSAQSLPSAVTWWPVAHARARCDIAHAALPKSVQAERTVKYLVSLDEEWQVNVMTGTFRRVTCSRWFYQRSDGHLQPLPRAVDDAIQQKCDAEHWDALRTCVMVDSDRVITAGVLGGLVQVRKASRRCRFVTNVFCYVVQFVVHVSSFHPAFRDDAQLAEAVEVLAFRERREKRRAGGGQGSRLRNGPCEFRR